MKLFTAYSLFVACFILFQIPAWSQDIQWASSLDFVYNEYGENDYSASKVLGKPDAAPFGVKHENAFTLKSEASFGTVVVSYERPQLVRSIIIIENHLPGRITSVILYDNSGTRYQVYKNGSSQVTTDNRSLIIHVPETNYMVSKVEVNLDTQTFNGWSQIDAIGITDEGDARNIKIKLADQGLKNFHEELSYGDSKTNLGPNINTSYNETRPVISPDGKVLYFCRQNYPENIRGTDDPQDIYYATLENGQWSTAKNIGTPLNDVFANGINSVSPDGNSLLLINEYTEFQPVSGVSLTYKTREGWNFPERLTIKDYYNNNEYADFFLSSDGKALIMAIQRDDSEGDQDIYVSLDQWGNTWSEPISLGKVINTPKAEFAPFLSADGKTLYFASEGHKGFGGSDIFFSERLDDSWLNWSEPKNMGSMINSPYWDAYYSTTAKGDYAYFVSTKDAKAGSKDIFKIPLPKKIKPEPVLLLSGRLTDNQSTKPLFAQLEFKSLQSNEILGKATTNSKDGQYMVTLPIDHDYLVTSRAIGYITKEDTLYVGNRSKYTEMSKNIFMEVIEIGKTVVMERINFKQGEAVLLEESYPELERLLQFLQDNPNLVIELGGHTDGTGSYRLNMKLSEERVKIVKGYLQEHGIDGKKIVIKAYGSTKPLASNAREETRRLNRRVEIKILKYLE